MKHVVKESEVAHLWANQLQSDARNAHGNFYFNGETIFSYGSHFPIARIYTDKYGNKIVFFTLLKYSNTTSGHIWTVKSAASHIEKLYMKNPLLNGVSKDNYNHKENIEYWIDNIQTLLDYLPKARKKESVFAGIESNRNELNAYIKFFGVKLNAAQKKVVNAIDSPDIVEKCKLLAKKEKEAKEKRVKLASKHFAANLEAWHNSEKKAPHVRTEEMREYEQTLNKTYLRVNCVNIETSKGVNVPIETAKRYYAFYLRIVKNGGCKGDCNYKMLNYDVSLANEQELVIGCHKIDRSEINAVASKLGW